MFLILHKLILTFSNASVSKSHFPPPEVFLANLCPGICTYLLKSCIGMPSSLCISVMLIIGFEYFTSPLPFPSFLLDTYCATFNQVCWIVFRSFSNTVKSSSEILYSRPILIALSFFWRIQSHTVMTFTLYLSATSSQVYILDKNIPPFCMLFILVFTSV